MSLTKWQAIAASAKDKSHKAVNRRKPSSIHKVLANDNRHLRGGLRPGSNILSLTLNSGIHQRRRVRRSNSREGRRRSNSREKARRPTTPSSTRVRQIESVASPFDKVRNDGTQGLSSDSKMGGERDPDEALEILKKALADDSKKMSIKSPTPASPSKKGPKKKKKKQRRKSSSSMQRMEDIDTDQNAADDGRNSTTSTLISTSSLPSRPSLFDGGFFGTFSSGTGGAEESRPIKNLTTLKEVTEWCRSSAPLFVGVDIDETLIMTDKTPSWLLTSYGVAMFQQYVSRRFSDFQTKNKWCRMLEQRLKYKRAVEGSTTLNFVKTLQESGCWVFGVTARYSEMDKETENTLAKLGINLNIHSPFPSEAAIHDPVTDALCVNGILYCNSLSKGVIVDRMFENVVLGRQGQKEGEPSASSLGCVDVSRAKGFVFIDDNPIHLQSLQSLECANTRKLPIQCFLYKPDCMVDDDSDIAPERLAMERGKLLMEQMNHFVEKQEVLSNVEARAILSAREQGTLNTGTA